MLSSYQTFGFQPEKFHSFFSIKSETGVLGTLLLLEIKNVQKIYIHYITLHLYTLKFINKNGFPYCITWKRNKKYIPSLTFFNSFIKRSTFDVFGSEILVAMIFASALKYSANKGSKFMTVIRSDSNKISKRDYMCLN